ncbi:MAG: FecCD family ABC transporter permease [Pseudomonadota bacterium]
MKRLTLPLLLFVLVAGAIASLFVGSTSLDGEAVISAMLSGSATSLDQAIVFEVRLPRVLLAILVGAGVATAGAAIQGIFRNPLADPALIGVSSGAALFAAGAIVLGAGGIIPVSLAAFLGGLLATGLVLEIGRHGGNLSSMLLAGIAINAIALAGVGIFTYLSDDLLLRSVSFWALGSLNGADWHSVAAAACIPAVILMFYLESRRLNVITLGDAEALHLGVSVSALRLRIVIYTALVVGVAVSVAGVIAFVGLVVPHLVRLSVGSNHRVVMPGAALLGAILLLLADGIGRTIIAPAELPVGIITALVGGPFFIYLIVSHKGKLGI